MAIFEKWNPFGVAIDLEATAGTVKRISATQFTVAINASWAVSYSGNKTNYGMKVESGGKTIYIPKFTGSNFTSGSGSLTGTFAISGNGSQSKTISVVFTNYKDVGGGASKTLSIAVTVPAWVTYTITYNANSGSGAPSSQTKNHGIDLKLSETVPTRSGYTFVGWALTKADADAGTWYYQPGYACGKNENLTLYAVWRKNSYTVTYDANGGSDAPSNQTKTPNTDLTLRSTKPTRNGYVFEGWATSATSGTIAYNPGDTYTANADIILYAVWVAVPPPGITNFTVDRCNSDKTLNENGKYALVKFDYSVGTESVNNGTYSIYAYEFGSTTVYTYKITIIETESDSVSILLGNSSKLFDTEKSYTITVNVGDVYGYSSDASLVLGEAADSLEFIPGNKGVRLPKNVHGNVLGLAGLPEITSNADFNTYTSTGVWGIKTNAIAATISNIPIKNAGRLIVAHAIGGQAGDSEFDYLIQTYIPYLVTYPIYERHIRKTAESTWIYSPWVVITRNRHSMISAWATSNITKEATGETQIPLQGFTAVGDGLTIENNAIVIGQYITAVEVSAAGMINCASAANASAKNLYIRKNGTDVAISMNGSWSTTKANFQLNVSPKLIEVKEGDKITFHWYASYNTTTNGGDILQGVAARTYITVKEF